MPRMQSHIIVLLGDKEGGNFSFFFTACLLATMLKEKSLVPSIFIYTTIIKIIHILFAAEKNMQRTKKSLATKDPSKLPY